MRVLSTDQRSPDWFKARLGMLTGSRASDMMATVQKGEAAKRRDLRVQLVLERLTGVSQENGYVSKDMQYGLDREADAFAAYEAETGLLTNSVGFLAHDELQAGCSLDGQIDSFTGVLELKCRRSANHLSMLKTRKVPYDAMWQVTHAIWITGAQWADYVSFDDRFPEQLRLVVARVQRADLDLAGYETSVKAFLAEIEKEMAAVQGLMEAVHA
jgi:YqaJ-like viral recombinase domain